MRNPSSFTTLALTPDASTEDVMAQWADDLSSCTVLYAGAPLAEIDILGGYVPTLSEPVTAGAAKMVTAAMRELGIGEAEALDKFVGTRGTDAQHRGFDDYKEIIGKSDAPGLQQLWDRVALAIHEEVPVGTPNQTHTGRVLQAS